jgi:hypothetical protein
MVRSLTENKNVEKNPAKILIRQYPRELPVARKNAGVGHYSPEKMSSIGPLKRTREQFEGGGKPL